MTKQEDQEKWRIECERLGNSIAEQFEDADECDDTGNIPPERAVDAAFRVLDTIPRLERQIEFLNRRATKAEQERDDALKREADPSTTSSAHCGEDETVAQMERFKVRARQEAMVIGNLYCLNGDAVYQVSQNILSAMVAAWVAGCISAAGER
jgi:uncharacterized protein (DUF885 family)